MGSRGRSSREYRAAAALFRTGNFPCWLRYPGCTGVGLTVDHDPALSSAPTPELWRGRLMPACARCQCVQGARIRHKPPGPTWKF